MSRALALGLVLLALLPLAAAGHEAPVAVSKTDCATVTTVGPVLAGLRTVCAIANASYDVACRKDPGDVLVCDLTASVGGGGSSGDLGLPGVYSWRGVVRSTWCDAFLCEARDTIEEDKGSWAAAAPGGVNRDERNHGFTNHFETKANAANPCILYDADAFADTYTYTPGTDAHGSTVFVWAKHASVETPQAVDRFCL